MVPDNGSGRENGDACPSSQLRAGDDELRTGCVLLKTCPRGCTSKEVNLCMK
jgi:hypothetical protein